jgi:hypothetical protein
LDCKGNTLAAAGVLPCSARVGGGLSDLTRRLQEPPTIGASIGA